MESIPMQRTNLPGSKQFYTWGFNSRGELGLGFHFWSLVYSRVIVLNNKGFIGDENIRLQPARLRVLDRFDIFACAAGSRQTIALAYASLPQRNSRSELLSRVILSLSSL